MLRYKGEYDANAMIMQRYRSGIRIPLLRRSPADLLEADIPAGDEIIDRSEEMHLLGEIDH